MRETKTDKLMLPHTTKQQRTAYQPLLYIPVRTSKAPRKSQCCSRDGLQVAAKYSFLHTPCCNNDVQTLCVSAYAVSHLVMHQKGRRSEKAARRRGAPAKRTKIPDFTRSGLRARRESSGERTSASRGCTSEPWSRMGPRPTAGKFPWEIRCVGGPRRRGGGGAGVGGRC